MGKLKNKVLFESKINEFWGILENQLELSKDCLPVEEMLRKAQGWNFRPLHSVKHIISEKVKLRIQ